MTAPAAPCPDCACTMAVHQPNGIGQWCDNCKRLCGATTRHGRERLPNFRPGTKRDGRWHAMTAFSLRPMPVRTWPRNSDQVVIQHHRGTHASVTRWDGTKWVYQSCSCMHRRRSTMLRCAGQLARALNRALDHPVVVPAPCADDCQATS